MTQVYVTQQEGPKPVTFEDIAVWSYFLYDGVVWRKTNGWEATCLSTVDDQSFGNHVIVSHVEEITISYKLS